MISFKQFLTESSNSVLDYFIPEQLNTAKHLKWKSRDKLIWMPIDLFLQLARPGHRDESEQRVWDMIQRGEKFELPHLQIDTHTDPTVTIVEPYGHEGRHRARALKRLGYTKFPVLLQSSTLRWSEQDDSSKFDYRENWPQYIKSETGHLFPFPVSREQSVVDFHV